MSAARAPAALFVAGAALATATCALTLFPYGMWVGARDVRLLQAADRAAAFAACADQDAVAVRIARDRARPDTDVWRCYGGSQRFYRHLSPPLRHPLAKGTP